MPPDTDPNDPVQQALATAQQVVSNPSPSYIKEPDPTQRALTPSGLYSHAADVVSRMPQAKGTPQQFKAMLLKQGVKPDELKWSGYDPKLGSKPVVTRDELRRHFTSGLPPIREKLLTPGEGNDDLERLENGTAQYGEYTLPGGKNYRELLLHLPQTSRLQGKSLEPLDAVAKRMFGVSRYIELSQEQKAQATQAQNSQLGIDYKSSHWEDTPNVLAHIRMSDRKAGKQKALHVEELQSDWAQDARKHGFAKPEYRARGSTAPPEAPYVDSTSKWLDLALKRVLHEAAHGGHDRVLLTPGDEQTKRYDLSQQIDSIMHRRNEHGLIEGRVEKNGDTIHQFVHKPEDLAGVFGKEIADKMTRGEGESASWHNYPGAEKEHRRLSDLDLKVGGEGMKAFYDRIVPQALEKLARKHDPEARVQLHAHRLYKGRSKAEIDKDMDALHDPNNPDAFEQRQTEHRALQRERDKAHGQPEHALHSLAITPKMRASIKRGQPAYASGGAVAGGVSTVTRNVHEHPDGGEMHTYDVMEDRPGRAKGGRVEPTEAQKEAGNYRKSRINFQGLPISIENRKGSVRSGVGPGGRHWSVKMPADYGYIRGTEGADGDHVDVYVGEDHKSPIAFIVNQHDHRSGKFDEHKIVLGTRSEREARTLYCNGFSDGKGMARLGSLHPVSIDALKVWLRDRRKTVKPARTSSLVDHALKIAAEATR